MKVLFVHDHRFRRVNGSIYSTGGLNNEVLKRYTRHCDSLVVVARIIDEENENSRWTEIINPKVKIIGGATFKCDDLEKEISTCDRMIVRLPSFLGSYALHINRKYNRPYLIEMVGCAWDSLWHHGMKGKLVAPIMYIYNKQCIKKAPYVLYVTKSFLQSRYPSMGKTIGCSDVEIAEFEKKVEQNRLEKISDERSVYILGTIAAIDVRYKGQEYVIRALGELKKRGIDRYEYWLVGNGSNEYLKKIAMKCNVADKIKFLGGIPHENIFTWLDTIDIYVQPSKLEGLPRALVEAMSRGVPVIASKVGGIPELVREDYRFLPNNYKSIANILSKLERDEMLEMSKESFERSFEYQKSRLDEIRADFYRDFLENKGFD